MKHFIGIDVGGTNLRGGIVDENHRPSREISVETPNNFVDFKKSLDDICWQLNSDFDYALDRGIALPGVIDSDQKKVIVSPNMPYLNDRSLSDICDNAVFGNDVDMALLGEIELREELKKKKVLLINIGTGIGGALALKGVGSWQNNLPVEIGHMVAMPGGRTCACGHRGCLEAYFSGVALLNQAKEKISPDIDTVEKLFEMALDHSAEVEKIINEGAVALGVTIASLVNIFGLDTVLIGGKIGQSFETFAGKAYLIAQQHLFGRKEFEIKKASLIDKGGMIGAAINASKF